MSERQLQGAENRGLRERGNPEVQLPQLLGNITRFTVGQLPRLLAHGLERMCRNVGECAGQ